MGERREVQTWEAGDEVVLISGGPRMTVRSRTNDNHVVCSWFAADGTLRTDTFKQDTLRKPWPERSGDPD